MSDSGSDILNRGEILEDHSGGAPVLTISRRCRSRIASRRTPSDLAILQHLSAQNINLAPSLHTSQLQELAIAIYYLNHTPPPSFALSDLETLAPVDPNADVSHGSAKQSCLLFTTASPICKP